MRKFLGLLVLATLGACLHPHPPPMVEAPDPEVGDMHDAPPMSIHDLLESDYLSKK